VGAYQIEKGPVFPFLKDQRGQSIVEYTLLLVVVIAIAVAAGVRLFKPASQWVDFYLGTYTQCLLDSGQLPKIAGGNPQECEDLPGNPTAAGGPGDPNNPANQAAKNKGNEINSGAGSSGSGSGAGGGSGSRSRRSAKRGGKSFAADQKGVGGGGSDSSFGDSDGNQKNKVRMVGAGISSNAYSYRDSSRVRYLGINDLMDQEKRKIKRREERISKLKDVEMGDFRIQKKITLKPSERKTANDGPEVESFSFGGLIRIIIIVAIILITIIVIGSQLNTISKSMDK